MKQLLTFIFVLTCMTSFGFASDKEDVGENVTECKEMAESNDRFNTKASLSSQSTTTRTKRPTATAQ